MTGHARNRENENRLQEERNRVACYHEDAKYLSPMYLGGQADGDARGQKGYAMAVLLVTMSIMAVMMTMAMPVWKQTARREKETELVFRGEQYARAIGLFQRKSGPGVLPPSIDLLVEQRFLRKKYKDPITNDDFAPVVPATVAAQPGAAQPGAQPGPQAGTLGRGAGGGAQPSIGGQRGSTPGAATVAGIVGVTSKSKETSLRVYKGRSHYNEWQFIFVPQVQAPAAGAPAGAPGQRGRGAQGQGNQGPGFPQGFPGGVGGGGRNPGGGGGRNPSSPPRPGDSILPIGPFDRPSAVLHP